MQLQGKHPQRLKLDMIVCNTAGVDIVSLTLPMLTVDAAAKAAATLMLPPPSPRVASSVEGEDKEDNGEVDGRD